MAGENITDKVMEKVELAAEVGSKVANMVGNAFEKTIADTDPSAGVDEDTVVNYFTSFGIHIAMVIIVILLKWQYGKIEPIEIKLRAFIHFFSSQIAIVIVIPKDHVIGEISKMLYHFIERNVKISLS